MTIYSNNNAEFNEMTINLIQHLKANRDILKIISTMSQDKLHWEILIINIMSWLIVKWFLRKSWFAFKKFINFGIHVFQLIVKLTFYFILKRIVLLNDHKLSLNNQYPATDVLAAAI